MSEDDTYPDLGPWTKPQVIFSAISAVAVGALCFTGLVANPTFVQPEQVQEVLPLIAENIANFTENIKGLELTKIAQLAGISLTNGVFAGIATAMGVWTISVLTNKNHPMRERARR